MKAITLWQPWASLVACGAKRFETRHWAPPDHLIGQHLAIHAGMQFEAYHRPAALAAMQMALGTRLVPANLPAGAVVAIARLRAVHWSTGVSRDGHANDPNRITYVHTRDGRIYLNPGEEFFGAYEAGRCLWELDGLERLAHPIPVRGHQGLWEWRQ
jgi:hypothetical protein